MAETFNTLDLPGILAEIAEVAGESAALAVAKAKGGTRAYIPSEEGLSEGHWLVGAAGFEAARRIAVRLGGVDVDIPLGPYGTRARVHQTIRAALKEGRSEAVVARLAGVDSRTVRRHKSGETGGDGFRPDQHRLFS